MARYKILTPLEFITIEAGTVAYTPEGWLVLETKREDYLEPKMIACFKDWSSVQRIEDEP